MSVMTKEEKRQLFLSVKDAWPEITANFAEKGVTRTTGLAAAIVQFRPVVAPLPAARLAACEQGTISDVAARIPFQSLRETAGT